MGRKTRLLQEEAAKKYEVFQQTLNEYQAPKKVNKRKAAIHLPDIAYEYTGIRKPSEFKSSSYSATNRSRNYFKHLYCKYNVPEWLIAWLFAKDDVVINKDNTSCKFLMNIIYHMGAGKSVRELLKPYLSKTEMATFFRLRRPKDTNVNIYGHFIYCKAKSKKIEESVCNVFQEISGQNFSNGISKDIYSTFERFIEFCSKQNINSRAARDIYDYLVANNLLKTFSFKGRTLASCMNLVNAWHEEMNKRRRDLAKAKAKTQSDMYKIEYKRSSIQPYYHHDKDERHVVKVMQLRKYEDLVNEGRKMHNCVSSYHHYCEADTCQIFSLAVDDCKEATIEVRGNKVVQARSYCNGLVKGYPLVALKKWMNARHLINHFS